MFVQAMEFDEPSDSELELVAGEGKGRGSVAVGGVSREIWEER